MTQPTLPETICLPIKVDAFVFNPDVCAGPRSKIPPISQPNYTFLRLDASVVQNDVLEHVDLHATTPSDINRRLMNLDSNSVRLNRQGVYVSWTLPRVYRSGTAATPKATSGQATRAADQGFQNPTDATVADVSAPNFRPAPTRWLVVRTIHPESMIPAAALPKVQGWVIESDRYWELESIPVGDEYDLQVDFAPFVFASQTDDMIDQQAEVFVGEKTDATVWNEVGSGKPRVPLSVLNSANPIFADFQPHNGNVFSMLDNFKYGSIDSPQYLQAATASYYVIGWHYDEIQDVFNIPDSVSTTLGARLSACNITLPDGDSSKAWKKSPTSSRLLCHGAMYSVDWKVSWTDSKTKKYVGPDSIPANVAFDAIHGNMAVAVGTTPLDAVLSYVGTHVNDKIDPNDPKAVFLKEIEKDLVAIQALLISQDDGVDSQLEAQDLMYNYNYDRAEGGSLWHISGDDGTNKPTNPDLKTLQALESLNANQMLLDAAKRRIKMLQWSLFSEWWKYVSDASEATDADRIKKCVSCLTGKITTLSNKVVDLQSQITTASAAFPVLVQGTQPRFFQQKDPTLLVAGVQPGWPVDFLSDLTARLTSHIVKSTTAADPDFTSFVGKVLPRLGMTDQMTSTAGDLLAEFQLLRPDGTNPKLNGEKAFPLYHDEKGSSPDDIAKGLGWRDRWESTQPWFPLFMEWEGEYTHIPYEWWNLSDHSVPGSEANLTQVRYNIKDGYNLVDELAKQPAVDKRTLSGRILMLPQPGFSLATKVNQLFSNTVPEILDKYLSIDRRDELVAGLSALSTISAPLAGFTDHLLTRVQGGHIKPNQRPLGQKVQPMQAAWEPTADSIGIGKDQLVMVDTETDLTPYGSLVEYLPPDFSPFKPCTHGQFHFTKLNIIDKFGQAIHAIDPTPSPSGPPPMYPCISEFYACQNLAPPLEDYSNTVTRDPKGACEYLQLPPQINQMSRLNSAYVVRDETSPFFWRPASEWENPIWGWLVINYADYGMQFFTQEGKFYREVRLGGPSGTSMPKQPFLPFGPSKDNTTQLDFLIAKFADPDYLQSFLDTINAAFKNLAPAPNSYAEYLSSMIGKPLALTNIGVSLELSTDPLASQSTRNNVAPRIPLLPPGSLPADCPDCEPVASVKDSMAEPILPIPLNYTFDIHVGDHNRIYDGLIGYFNLAPTAKTPSVPSVSDYDLKQLFTYYPSSNKSLSNPTKLIGADNFPSLTPYYVRPEEETTVTYTLARNSNLTILGCIVDPFSKLHIYSDILPINELQLPSWTVQTGLAAMTAFFHMGPLLITADIPAFEEKYELDEKTDTEAEKLYPDATIGFPALANADWTWLQPYAVAVSPDTGGGSPSPDVTIPETKFMGLGLSKVDAKPRYESGPYTAVEGYLQLSTPITKPDT